MDIIVGMILGIFLYRWLISSSGKKMREKLVRKLLEGEEE